VDEIASKYERSYRRGATAFLDGCSLDDNPYDRQPRLESRKRGAMAGMTRARRLIAFAVHVANHRRIMRKNRLRRTDCALSHVKIGAPHGKLRSLCLADISGRLI
jgi:hypothetical protein